MEAEVASIEAEVVKLTEEMKTDAKDQEDASMGRAQENEAFRAEQENSAKALTILEAARTTLEAFYRKESLMSAVVAKATGKVVKVSEDPPIEHDDSKMATATSSGNAVLKLIQDLYDEEKLSMEEAKTQEADASEAYATATKQYQDSQTSGAAQITQKKSTKTDKLKDIANLEETLANSRSDLAATESYLLTLKELNSKTYF